ncbi:MAG: 50S ribosomal protein L11 methyltransferase [Bradymonadales bacterium]|nr:50S ribosomal protein L11 methyltransferase [Bradymonadales bacterium]
MWTRLILELASEELGDQVAAELWALGAIGLEIRDGGTFCDFDQSRFSPPPEDRATVTAYFPPDLQVSLVDSVVLMGPQVKLVEIASFHERSWQTDWRQFFVPTRVSPRVTIRPTWDTRLPPGDHHVVLVVDPQMAFGTGTHETTRLCIQEIDHLLQLRPGRSFLDVGCGSGILVMCAQRLDAGRCEGIDIDPVAVEVARANWELNGLGPAAKAPFFTTPLAELSSSYDLVVANMLSSTLSDVRDGLLRTLAADGQLVLSGVLAKEADRFFPAFAGGNLVIQSTRLDGDWILARMGWP